MLRYMGNRSWLQSHIALRHFGVDTVIDKYKGIIHGPTADQVMEGVDLTDRVCLLTGANSGIGREMTRCLHAHNCTVLMACRNMYAANATIKSIAEDKEGLIPYEVNLASLKSVKDCSDRLLQDQRKIDLVILNASVFGIPWTLTVDNLETSFQVNYLSQFYLLDNIEELLAPDARVVLVSSESHRNVKWSFHDQLSPTEELVSINRDVYTSIKAYNISKLCGLLAMHYLGYRWMNTKKTILAAHPGSFVKTRLCRNWAPYEALYTLMLPFSKTIAQAASTPLYCATALALRGVSAQYYKDLERRDESELAADLQLAFRLRDLTRELLAARPLGAAPARAAAPPPDHAKHIPEALAPSYST